MKIGFTLNGAPVCVEAPGTVSLLTLLRDYCRLTGTKRAATSANAAPARCCWTTGR